MGDNFFAKIFFSGRLYWRFWKSTQRQNCVVWGRLVTLRFTRKIFLFIDFQIIFIQMEFGPETITLEVPVLSLRMSRQVALFFFYVVVISLDISTVRFFAKSSMNSFCESARVFIWMYLSCKLDIWVWGSWSVVSLLPATDNLVHTTDIGYAKLHPLTTALEKQFNDFTYHNTFW